MDLTAKVFSRRFKVKGLIGKGSFGEVYQGEDLTTHVACAIKVEPVSTFNPQLLTEAKTLRAIQRMHGVPSLLWSGTEDSYNVLVMQLLGPSLLTLFQKCNWKFSLKTTLMSGDQIIQRLESMHNLNYIHRDVKPENFVIGTQKAGALIYILDFGLSKKYRDSVTHQHIPYRENRGLIGTAKYASLNSHMGMEQGRRDDLEALAYVLINFAKGSLPWQGITADIAGEKYRRIMDQKLNLSYPELCKGLPEEFSTFLRYTRALRFDETPDYEYLRRVLRDCVIREQIKTTPVYDWMKPEPQSAGLKAKSIPTQRSLSRHKLFLPMDHSEPQNTGSSRNNESTKVDCTTGPILRQSTRDAILKLTIENKKEETEERRCNVM